MEPAGSRRAVSRARRRIMGSLPAAPGPGDAQGFFAVDGAAFLIVLQPVGAFEVIDEA